MKLSLSTAELLTQLQTVTRVASTRSAVQALSGVMISAPEGSTPELLATDMEIGLRVPLPAEMAHPGAVVLPARLLARCRRSLPAEQLTLELRTAEQDVELISGSATFHLRTLRAEDFPALPAPPPETRITLPTEAFVQTVSHVARSASRDETRPVLTGILMSASGQELRMVATDSYRLSVKETALETPLQGSLEANIPARALQELARIAQQAASESLAVSVGQNQVVFEFGEIVLSSRLIDGQFPNYRQLLPESVEHELRLSERRADRCRAPHQPAGPEERASAPQLPRGRADDLGADPGRRRGLARRSRSPSTASRSRSASTPSSCATGSRASSPTSSSSS